MVIEMRASEVGVPRAQGCAGSEVITGHSLPGIRRHDEVSDGNQTTREEGG